MVERSFSFLTLTYGSFNSNMIYVDIKVAFEIVYVILSLSYSMSRFQEFLLCVPSKFSHKQTTMETEGRKPDPFRWWANGEIYEDNNLKQMCTCLLHNQEYISWDVSPTFFLSE